MKIFQPMLFVGLGGTGGLIGAELERRLRGELCGPDGTALTHLGGHAPYQLPDCLQFVYADFSESDLRRLPQFNVDTSLRAASCRTSTVRPTSPRCCGPACATRSAAGCRRGTRNRG
jgi:tubulin-like protein